jgi:hypothetical protein
MSNHPLYFRYISGAGVIINGLCNLCNRFKVAFCMLTSSLAIVLVSLFVLLRHPILPPHLLLFYSLRNDCKRRICSLLTYYQNICLVHMKNWHRMIILIPGPYKTTWIICINHREPGLPVCLS